MHGSDRGKAWAGPDKEKGENPGRLPVDGYCRDHLHWDDRTVWLEILRLDSGAGGFPVGLEKGSPKKMEELEGELIEGYRRQK
jgi:hypothetical protein